MTKFAPTDFYNRNPIDSIADSDKGFIDDASDSDITKGFEWSQVTTFIEQTLAAISNTIACADNVLERPELKDYAETLTTADTGATYTIDLENGNVFDLTLTGNCTFTFSNPPASGKGGSFTLKLNQDATGSRTTTWPASVDWAGGTAPTLTTTANAVDVLTFITVDGGTTWYGFLAGANFS